MARVFPITLTSPGRRGLNKERANDLLGPEWATDALNCVLNREGRIAARKGWTNQTIGAASDNIVVLHEYVKGDASVEMIAAGGTKIFSGITDFTDPLNDITPSTAPTADNWQFLNFNDKVIGIQEDHTMIVYDGSGDFSDLVAVSGTAPRGVAGCAAFGRLWVIDDDGQTIKYCALLDETKWSESDGGGSIDLRNVWTQGMDRAVAVIGFGANLIVFGTNHIIFYTDAAGSELGVNPNQLYVVDTIEGTGCVARDSIQPIGEGDVVYLSRHGIQALGRVIREKSNPTVTISKNIRTYLSNLLTQQVTTSIRSAYSPEHGLYLLLLPDARRVIVADTRFLFTDEDGALVAPMLEWTFDLMPMSVCVRRNGDLLFGFDGMVGEYEGNQDGGESYSVEYSSPWLLVEDPTIANGLKILKEIPTIVQVNGNTTISWLWEFDFSGEVFTGRTEHVAAGLAEWGEAEFNVDEFSGGLILQKNIVEGQGEGQFLRVGLHMNVDGFDFVLQQIKLLFKLGRMAA